MEDNKFYKNRESWGVHSIVPLSKIKDYSCKDNSMKVKVRLNLLYLKLNIFCCNSQTDPGFGL